MATQRLSPGMSLLLTGNVTLKAAKSGSPRLFNCVPGRVHRASIGQSDAVAVSPQRRPRCGFPKCRTIRRWRNRLLMAATHGRADEDNDPLTRFWRFGGHNSDEFRYPTLYHRRRPCWLRRSASTRLNKVRFGVINAG